MSEMSKKARSDAKDKVGRLLRIDPKGGYKVDASGYSPPSELGADVKVGMRPLSKRQFKSGGLVGGATALKNGGRAHRVKKDGGGSADAYNQQLDAAAQQGSGKLTKEQISQALKNTSPPPSEGVSGDWKRGGRAQRASGGKLPTGPMNNTNMKDLNEERIGEKHVGGMKKGGRAHKMGGGPMVDQRAPMGANGNLPPSELPPSTMFNFSSNKSPILKRGGRALPPGDTMITGTRPTGGRLAKADGGRAGKGKMNVNIIIASPHSAPPAGGPPMGPPPGAPPHPIVPPPGAGGPPGMGPGGLPPGMGAPPGGMPQQPLGRRDGGRTLAKMRYGSGSGEGRLEKIEKYGD